MCGKALRYAGGDRTNVGNAEPKATRLGTPAQGWPGTRVEVQLRVPAAVEAPGTNEQHDLRVSHRSVVDSLPRRPAQQARRSLKQDRARGLVHHFTVIEVRCRK